MTGHANTESPVVIFLRSICQTCVLALPPSLSRASYIVTFVYPLRSKAYAAPHQKCFSPIPPPMIAILLSRSYKDATHSLSPIPPPMIAILLSRSYKDATHSLLPKSLALIYLYIDSIKIRKNVIKYCN